MSFGGSIKLTGESEYRRAVKQINNNLRELGTELKLVTASYNKNDHSVQATNARNKVFNKTLESNKEKLSEATRALEKMGKAQEENAKKHDDLKDALNEEKAVLERYKKETGHTKKEIKEQEEKVKDLEKAYKKSESTLSANETQMSRMRQTVNRTKTEIVKNEKAIKDNTKAHKEQKNATAKGEKAVEKFGKAEVKAGKEAIKMGSLIKANVLSSGIISGIKGLGNAMFDVGRAFVSVGKQSLESFAEQEQLMDGVKTLFKDNADIVISNSKKAYKTVGMNANEYLETVTGFSASMLQAVGGDTKKAADMAQLATVSMADNAAKMGTPMESIKNAYGGFAKQNYTMLDNLKLGYGGTKEEMQRLLLDAEKFSGKKYDISSFADVTSAIQTVQEHLGFAGTAAEEASKTISGSVNMTKDSWADLITGISDDNANFSELVGNFIESLIAAASNLLPRMATMLGGVMDLIGALVVNIGSHAPQMLESGRKLLESLLSGIKNTVPKALPIITKMLTNILTYLANSMPKMINKGADLIKSLNSGLSKMIPKVIPLMVKTVLNMTKTIAAKLPELWASGVKLLNSLTKGISASIPKVLQQVPIIVKSFVTSLINNLPAITVGAFKIGVTLAKGIIKSIPHIITVIPKIFAALLSAVRGANWSSIGKDIVKGVARGFTSIGGYLSRQVSAFKGQVMSKFKSMFGIHSPSHVMRDEVGTFVAQGVGVGFTEEMDTVTKQMADALPTKFDTAVGLDVATDINTFSNAQNSSSGSTGGDLKELIELIKNLKITLDGDEVGRFVDGKVTDLVFS